MSTYKLWLVLSFIILAFHPLILEGQTELHLKITADGPGAAALREAVTLWKEKNSVINAELNGWRFFAVPKNPTAQEAAVAKAEELIRSLKALQKSQSVEILKAELLQGFDPASYSTSFRRLKCLHEGHKVYNSLAGKPINGNPNTLIKIRTETSELEHIDLAVGPAGQRPIAITPLVAQADYYPVRTKATLLTWEACNGLPNKRILGILSNALEKFPQAIVLENQNPLIKIKYKSPSLPLQIEAEFDDDTKFLHSIRESLQDSYINETTFFHPLTQNGITFPSVGVHASYSFDSGGRKLMRELTVIGATNLSVDQNLPLDTFLLSAVPGTVIVAHDEQLNEKWVHLTEVQVENVAKYVEAGKPATQGGVESAIIWEAGRDSWPWRRRIFVTNGIVIGVGGLAWLYFRRRWKGAD